MTLVTLITTGKVEQMALGTFLGSVFPGVAFRTEYTDGFTSARLLDSFAKVPTNAAKLAARLVAAVDPGRRIPSAARADYAVAIDDLELYNIDQPQRVVDLFRVAVKSHVDHIWPSDTRRQTAFERLRNQASFHLLSPMIESYFFSNPNAVAALRLPSMPSIREDVDLEEFWTNDANYSLAVSSLGCRTRGGKAWTATEWYERHPKHYIKYLLNPTSPYDKTASAYRETHEGVDALNALTFDDSLANPEHLTFLRSLIHDLAMALNTEPLPVGRLNPHTSGS